MHAGNIYQFIINIASERHNKSLEILQTNKYKTELTKR
jgi:hypothetical protein